MQVMIVDDHPSRQAALNTAFTQAGFQTVATGSQIVADLVIRQYPVDLLVMAERVEGRLTHALALLAEHRNPLAVSILLTPRTDPDVDELFLLLPSLYGLLAPDTRPALVARLALAAVTGTVRLRPPMVLDASLRVDADSGPVPVFASGRVAVTSDVCPPLQRAG